MATYEYVIIGGGISGLYSAYQLNKRFGTTSVIVLEKNNRLGGRIYSMHTHDIYIELGASRISSSQKHVLQLVDELGLTDDLTKGSNGRSLVNISTIPGNKIIPTIYRIDGLIDIYQSDFYPIIKDLTERVADPNFYQVAKSYNLYALIEKFYGSDTASRLTYQFGYRDDFHVQNSIEALNMFKREFSPESIFHGFKHGMSQIITRLADKLTDKQIELRLKSKCVRILNDNHLYKCEVENSDPVYGKNIILAMPKEAILQIKYLESASDKLSTIVAKPLVRVYLFFPVINGVPWFNNIHTTLTTSTLLSQIIPMDKSKGLMMVYCDGQNALTLDSLNRHGQLKSEIMYELIKLFIDIDIPEPLDIITSYNPAATHVWAASVDPLKMYKETMQPLAPEPIYVVGEAYSLDQQWSAGAIASVNDLMGILGKN